MCVCVCVCVCVHACVCVCVCVCACVCVCVSQVECEPHRTPGPVEPIGPIGCNESRGDRRECGAQRDGRAAGMSGQTGAGGIAGLEGPKVHVVSMDNSDSSVYRKESCMLHILFLYDQHTASTALQPIKGIQTEQMKK